VFDDAVIEDAVEWIMFGVFWNRSQDCSATSRVLGDPVSLDEQTLEYALEYPVLNRHIPELSPNAACSSDSSNRRAGKATPPVRANAVPDGQPSVLLQTVSARPHRPLAFGPAEPWFTQWVTRWQFLSCASKPKHSPRHCTWDTRTGCLRTHCGSRKGSIERSESERSTSLPSAYGRPVRLGCLA
jgi:hypothetical protein